MVILYLKQISIVEDYSLTRITYKCALRDYDDVEIVGDFETAEACLAALERRPVNVILMDLGLPYMTGIEATKIIHEKYPDILRHYCSCNQKDWNKTSE